MQRSDEGGRPHTDFIALARFVLRQHEARRVHAPELMPAAVLLLLSHAAGEDRVLLTVRSNTVEHHKGQISFPGGAVHPADDSLATTALRETWEEVGISPEHVEIVGRLDEMVTISHFLVTPFVGVLSRTPYEYVPSPLEVAEIIEPPVGHLLDPENQRWEERQSGERVVRSPAFYYEGHRIWGATARMLQEFLLLLSGDATAFGEARADRGP